MRIRWYGQSAFLLTGEQHRVFIDPFGDIASAMGRGDWSWDYPPVEGVDADVLLVTHDHLDHNAVEAIAGEPLVLAKAGTHDSPIGEVVGIASEHDAVAGTERGPNTIFRFVLDGTTVAHFGDFGQPRLRPDQWEALGDVDVLLLPVGGGPTIAPDAAAELVGDLRPRLVVPMHYKTPAIGFLDPPDAFLEALGVAGSGAGKAGAAQRKTPAAGGGRWRVERLETSEAEVEPLLGSREEPVVALLAPPSASS